MSGTQIDHDPNQEPVLCTLFGEAILLPVDTEVRVTVGVYDPRPQQQPGGEILLGYTVGMRFVVSHANLVVRKRVFSERSHRLKIEVRTSCPYEWDQRRQFFLDELDHIAPILGEMEDLAHKNYYEGEVSFDTLRAYFISEYRRRSGARFKRKARKH